MTNIDKLDEGRLTALFCGLVTIVDIFARLTGLRPGYD